ncbi:cation efflux protein [Chiua virens]|nr:cation efflux protein [Chiua virens]
MSAPDARTRRKISLQPARVLSVSLGTRAFPKIVLSNIVFVLALFAAKEVLLSYDVGVFWVVMRVLALGALGMLVWEGLTFQFSNAPHIEWTALGVSSLLLFVQQAALYTALYRLPSLRVILFVHFSSSWVDAMISRPLIVVSAFVISFFADIVLSQKTPAIILPGYACVVLHGLATYALEHLRGVLSPTITPTMVTAASTFGASVLGLPLYAFRRVLIDSRPSPVVPLLSLAVLPLLAYNTIFLTPDTKTRQYNSHQAVQVFLLSYPSAFLVAIAMGRLGFSQHPHWIDFILGAMLYYAKYPDESQVPLPSRTPISKLARFYLNSILSDNESRKIFYFLALNLCYMLIQMLYGVWTNSLGLISDAIHMAFDCLAIGVGLLASVMAKWPPNERFTYGYGRIETLSGFANGIFLILISIFIVFEAVQRLIDPPEMSTSQLLLISSLGLGVNLFGMFAMGGHHHHHHHGHDHGCGHEHGHNHGHQHKHSHTIHSHPDGHGSSLLHHDHASHDVCQNSNSHTLDSDDHRTHDVVRHSLAPSQDPPSHSHHHHESKPSHSHSHVHNHSNRSEFHSSPAETQHSPVSSTIRERKPHSRGPSLQVTLENDQATPIPTVQVPFPSSSPVDSPISPNYPSTLKHDHHPVHHHHDDGHGHTLHSHYDHEGHSHNMRGVFLHVMADTLGSVGVIVSTLLIQYYGWTGFDPIASLFIAVLIVASVVPLVMDTGRVLSLDLGEKESGVEMALKELEHVEGVVSYSSPRFWPKDSSSVIGSIHLQLSHTLSQPHTSDGPSSKQLTIDRVLERVNSLLKSRIPGLEEVTIQLEVASAG